ASAGVSSRAELFRPASPGAPAPRRMRTRERSIASTWPGLRQGPLRSHGSIGRNVDQESFVVGHLTDTGVLDRKVDATYRRKDAINRDLTDGQFLTDLADVAIPSAALDHQLGSQAATGRVDRGQALLWVDHFDLIGRAYVGRSYRTLALSFE